MLMLESVLWMIIGNLNMLALKVNNGVAEILMLILEEMVHIKISIIFDGQLFECSETA